MSLSPAISAHGHDDAAPANKILLALLALAWALVLLRMWGGAMTGGDEPFTATSAQRLGGIFSAAWEMATSQARFYQLVFYPLAQIPYLVDSLAWTNAFRIFSSGIAVLTFFLFADRLYGRRIALLAGFLLLGLQDTVGGGYNPFHALPLWFSFGLALFFLSLHTYTRAVAMQRATGPAYTLFFCSLLTYEPMLFYVLAFPLIWHVVTARDLYCADNHLAGKVLGFCRGNLGLFVSVLLYSVAYIGFRSIFPPSYAGVSGFTWTTLADVSQTIYSLSTSGIYTKTYWEWWTQYRVMPLLFAAIVMLAIAACLLRTTSAPLAGKPFGVVNMHLVGLLPFVFLPNVLFGLTERYREWARHGSYIGSYFSSFAICLMLAVLLAGLLHRHGRRLRVLSAPIWSATAVLLVLVGYLAYCNHYQSLDFFNRSHKETMKWKAIDHLAAAISAGQIKDLPADMCSKTLMAPDNPYQYWTWYLSRRAGQWIEVHYDDGKADCPVSFNEVKGQYVLSDANDQVLWASPLTAGSSP